ncbi:prolyl oligopeptidase family serine peptidase [Pseudoxanthomonas koreensis]|uniref:dipeptidyl-peptidase 5 n=1 Tax=Pseudoxanthomonas koreensis TaxID=266061 RepID=UPI0035A57DD5
MTSPRSSLVFAMAGLLGVLVLPSATQAATRGFDVRDLQALERASSPLLSPDGAQLVLARRQVALDDGMPGKATTGLWIRDLRTRDLAPPRRLTPADWSVSAPAFSADGRTVYFLSAQSGSNQLYAMPVAGGTPRQVTGFALDVGSYRLSPDGRRVAFSADTFAECAADFACTRERLDRRAADKASGMLYDSLFVRHWDTWKDGRRSRLFVATLPAAGARVATAVALGAGLDGDIPSKPFGGKEDYAWVPDGSGVVASVRVAGRSEPWSTNFDLYHLPADGGAPVNLTAANPAWDAGPVFSADGRTLFYRAMKRAGFEADRFALMARDMATGATRQIAPGWDRSADDIAVAADGRTLYVAAQDTGEHPLFAVDVASGQVRKLVAGGTVSEYAVAGGTLAFTRNSLHSGNQVFTAPASDPQAQRAITPSAGELLPEVAFGAFEQFSFPGWNGETVHGYVVKPWNYEEGKRYPVAFLIHGGPQGSFGNSWSYRWNPQTYAGQGYAVVMIDFHGSTGYGQAFTDSISGDWGGKPLLDLQKGWAAVQQKYPFLDGERACALGASYGGYMVNWIAGNWFDADGNSPWKCLVNHDGVFDTRSMGYVTEELWFTEWENGGTPYQVPENYEKFNPANHVARWKVPMLVVQGEKDYRVPVDQGLSTFTALQRRGIDSQLLYFPDENHWVLKPANSVLWHDTVNAWLKKHTGQ